MKQQDIAVIGLAVMGRSLALNMADHGFAVAAYNRSYAVSESVPQHNLLIPYKCVYEDEGGF